MGSSLHRKVAVACNCCTCAVDGVELANTDNSGVDCKVPSSSQYPAASLALPADDDRSSCRRG